MNKSGFQMSVRRAVLWADRTAQKISGGRRRVWDVAEAALMSAVIFGLILALAGAGSIDHRLGNETHQWIKIIAGVVLVCIGAAGLKEEENEK